MYTGYKVLSVNRLSGFVEVFCLFVLDFIIVNGNFPMEFGSHSLRKLMEFESLSLLYVTHSKETHRNWEKKLWNLGYLSGEVHKKHWTLGHLSWGNPWNLITLLEETCVKFGTFFLRKPMEFYHFPWGNMQNLGHFSWENPCKWREKTISVLDQVCIASRRVTTVWAYKKIGLLWSSRHTFWGGGSVGWRGKGGE